MSSALQPAAVFATRMDVLATPFQPYDEFEDVTCHPDPTFGPGPLEATHLALDAAGNDPITLLVVPDAEHVLQVATSKTSADVRDRIAP